MGVLSECVALLNLKHVHIPCCTTLSVNKLYFTFKAARILVCLLICAWLCWLSSKIHLKMKREWCSLKVGVNMVVVPTEWFTVHHLVDLKTNRHVRGGGGGVFHRTCHQWQLVIHWLLPWQQCFIANQNQECHFTCQWMTYCQWWQVLLKYPPNHKPLPNWKGNIYR